jgi:hypothetical protein
LPGDELAAAAGQGPVDLLDGQQVDIQRLDAGRDGVQVHLVADKGFAGQDFQQQVAGWGARLLRPDRADEPHRYGSLGGVRQWIQSAFDTLKDQLGLERHGGRTLAGVFVRVPQRLLALAGGIWWNWEIGAPDKRSLVAYDHWTHHQI